MLTSILTCVFNQREDYIRQCAQSVASQAADIEWIVVDDGSSPEGNNTLRRVLNEESRGIQVTLIELSQNSGLAAARNNALELARGEWVIVLDSDDRLAPGMVSALIELPKYTKLTCVEVNYFSDQVTEHRPIERYERLYRTYGGTVNDPLLWFDFYYHGLISHRSLLERIGGYNSSLRAGEDQDVLLRATESIGIEGVFFLKQVGYEYRNNPAGVCSSRWGEVIENYTRTMLEAANRRGGGFSGCRLAGTEVIDGATVDCYSYRSEKGEWLPYKHLLNLAA
jgi:glycosyltransferase involved in cell wall biosynthesis